MSTPKASGKREVRVYRMYECVMRGSTYSIEKKYEDAAYHLCDMPEFMRRYRNGIEPCIVITNPPPGLTAAKLKKLVQIAEMDEDSLMDVFYRKGLTEWGCKLAIEALGLSQPKARIISKRGMPAS